MLDQLVSHARSASFLAPRSCAARKLTTFPVLRPTKFELVINTKTAKALDLAVTQSLLIEADELIE